MERSIRYKKVIAALVVAAVGITAAVIFAANGGKKPQEETAVLREYPVTRGDITAGIDGTGTLAVDKIPQHFETPVTLEELYVQPGQMVKKGDKLAKLSVKALKDSLEELQNEQKKAQIALETAQNNKKSGALAAKKEEAVGGDAGKSEYEAQRVQLQNQAAAQRQAIDEADAEIAALEGRIAALTPGDPQLAGLRQALEAKQAERAAAQESLTQTEASASALDAARDSQVTGRIQTNGIDRQIQNLSQEDLKNAVALAQLDLQKVQKAVEETQQLLQDPYLYASASGTVMSVGYAAGASVKPETPVAVLSTLQNVTAEVAVAQGDIGGIEVGQRVELDLDAYPDQTFTGKVKLRELTPIKDSNPVAYRVVVELSPTEAELLEGMTGSMQFIQKQVKDVLQLSNKAVYQKDGKQYVKVKNQDGTLREQEVVTGFSDGKYSEIKSGLAEGDTVIVEG